LRVGLLTKHNIRPIIPGKAIIHATNDSRDSYKPMTPSCRSSAMPTGAGAIDRRVKDRLGGKPHKPARDRRSPAQGEWLARWEAKLRSTERR